MKFSSWLIIAGFLSATQAVAAEWKASANADITVEGLHWMGGPLGPDKVENRGIYSAKLPTSIKYGRTARLRLLPTIQWDPQNTSKSERFFWNPQEAYLQLQWLPWTIQAGWNVQNWGDTDVFNPLDVTNARRYFDPFRSEKLGSPGILIKRDFESFFMEALYIPEQPETLLPGESSRWLPREVYQSRTVASSRGTGTIILPSTLRYHYIKPGVMSAATKDNFGGRVKFRFPGFDWTLMGFYGAAVTPSVNLARIVLTASSISIGGNNAFVADPDVFLKAVYYKNRVAGTSFVWVLGDFLVKGASAQTNVISQLPGEQLPKDSWENALGFERTFGLGDGSMTALLQGTYVRRTDSVDSNSISLARMFDRAAMLGLRWTPNEKLTVTGSYLRDILFKGNLVHSELEYKIADGWRTKLSGDLLGGGTETPLGTYKRNDRVTLMLNTQL